MNRKEVFTIVITPSAIALIVLLVGIIIGQTINDLSAINWHIVRSLGLGVGAVLVLWAISCYFLIVVPAIRERKKALWKAEKEIKYPKMTFSADIHKSSNWKNDGLLLLCLHNQSWFRDIKGLSIGIATILKKTGDGQECVLERSVILHSKVNIPKRRTCYDLALLEIAKKENKFVISVLHQEDMSKGFFEHKFDSGEYVIHVWVKRNDANRYISIPIPIIIKYEGRDKISGKIDEIYSARMFPVSF